MSKELTKEQINKICEYFGNEEAYFILKRFYNSYRKTLTSKDVVDLYDEGFYKTMAEGSYTYKKVDKFTVSSLSKDSYEHIMGGKGSILDIGCGEGEFICSMISNGVSRAVGVDFDRKAIEKAKKKVGSFNCNVYGEDAVKFAGRCKEKFDYITFNDVVEHLADSELEVIFKAVIPLLNKNGELLIHTPNGLALCFDTDRNFTSKLYAIYQKYVKSWTYPLLTPNDMYYSQGHINIKSYRQLKTFLEQFNLKSKVYYDPPSKIPFKSKFAPSMFIVAKKA